MGRSDFTYAADAIRNGALGSTLEEFVEGYGTAFGIENAISKIERDSPGSASSRLRDRFVIFQSERSRSNASQLTGAVAALLGVDKDDLSIAVAKRFGYTVGRPADPLDGLDQPGAQAIEALKIALRDSDDRDALRAAALSILA